MDQVMENNIKVMGSRVVLSIPPTPESTIELTEEVKAKLQAEFFQQLKSLEVFAVGEDVTKVKPGDKVYVPASVASHSDKIIIDNQVKMIVGERDIAIIW